MADGVRVTSGARGRLRSAVQMLLLFTLVAVLAGCGMGQGEAATRPTAESTSSGPTGTLIVFAAASLADAFGEIGDRFEAAHPGVEVVFNFAGSQQLAQQLYQGAPADVFASANQEQMDVAIESGRVSAGTSQVFAGNRLVVVYPKENPAGLTELKDLATPGLRLILAAAEVPAGKYALEVLSKAEKDPALGASFREQVLNNVVSYEENVRAVLSKVVLGEADAGIVYVSDAAQEDAETIGQIEIPEALNVVALYPIAPVNDSGNAELAQTFIEFVLSPEGQAILERYGFAPD